MTIDICNIPTSFKPLYKIQSFTVTLSQNRVFHSLYDRQLTNLNYYINSFQSVMDSCIHYLQPCIFWRKKNYLTEKQCMQVLYQFYTDKILTRLYKINCFLRQNYYLFIVLWATQYPLKIKCDPLFHKFNRFKFSFYEPFFFSHIIHYLNYERYV